MNRILFSSLTAQERKYYTPEKGDWSVGVIFNPASMSSQMLAQPKPGDFVGKWISDNAASPHQMFMLSQDPVAAIRVKYRVRGIQRQHRQLPGVCPR